MRSFGLVGVSLAVLLGPGLAAGGPVVVRSAGRLPSPAEFAATFKPAPTSPGGPYEVFLEHPFTRAPVKVAFTLPPGAPRKVSGSKLRLAFDYGKRKVVVRFFRDGRVQVRY
jgi:hypothetical protein